MNTPYQILGEDGIRKLAATVYDVMCELPEAETIRGMHNKDLSEVQTKLGDYLIGWMGGPPVYHEKVGTVCLSDPHAAYPIGPDEGNAWLLCFNTALERIGASDELKEMLDEPVRRLVLAVQNREESIKKNTDPNIIGIG